MSGGREDGHEDEGGHSHRGPGEPVPPAHPEERSGLQRRGRGTYAYGPCQDVENPRRFLESVRSRDSEQ